MKKLLALFALILFLITAPAVFNGAMADDPPPPPPGHGDVGNVPGGGAPVGSGIAVLLSLGAAYGWKKYSSSKEEK